MNGDHTLKNSQGLSESLVEKASKKQWQAFLKRFSMLYPESNDEASPESDKETSPKGNGKTSPEINDKTSPESDKETSPGINDKTSSERNEKTPEEALKDAVKDALKRLCGDLLCEVDSAMIQVENKTYSMSPIYLSTQIKPFTILMCRLWILTNVSVQTPVPTPLLWMVT